MAIFDDKRYPQQAPAASPQTAAAPPMLSPTPQQRIADSGATTLPDLIGDIPPPPIPPPPSLAPSGGAPYTGWGGAVGPHPVPDARRFGPGVPFAGGGGGGGIPGLGDDTAGLGAPNDVAELLRALAAGRGPVT